jgi:hypothetical protein
MGAGRRVLWLPDPRLAHGEVDGQDITLLHSGVMTQRDKDKLAQLLHDNFWRRQSYRAQFALPVPRVGRMMLWGIIYLLTLESRGKLGGLLAGLYLLLALPAFEAAWYRGGMAHIRKVVASLRGQTMARDTRSIVPLRSSRLDELEAVHYEAGFTGVLEALDVLGLSHLRGIYRRAAWAESWKVAELPTGLGVLKDY